LAPLGQLPLQLAEPDARLDRDHQVGRLVLQDAVQTRGADDHVHGARDVAEPHLGAAPAWDDGQLVLGGDLDDGADLLRRAGVGDYLREDAIDGEFCSLVVGRHAANRGDRFRDGCGYGHRVGSFTLARHSPSAEDRARG